MSLIGKKPSQPEPEPPVDPEAPLDEDLRRKLEMLDPAVAHRAGCLLDMGFTLEQTLVLAKIPDIAHAAKPLIDKGCPVHIAFDLLSP